MFNKAVMSLCTALTSHPAQRAAWRIDITPAPHIAFRNAQRIVVSTFRPARIVVAQRHMPHVSAVRSQGLAARPRP